MEARRLYLRHFPQMVPLLSPAPSMNALHWSQFPIELNLDDLLQFSSYEERWVNCPQTTWPIICKMKMLTNTNWSLTRKSVNSEGSNSGDSPIESSSLRHIRNYHEGDSRSRRHVIACKIFFPSFFLF